MKLAMGGILIIYLSFFPLFFQCLIPEPDAVTESAYECRELKTLVFQTQDQKKELMGAGEYARKHGKDGAEESDPLNL